MSTFPRWLAKRMRSGLKTLSQQRLFATCGERKRLYCFVDQDQEATH